MAFVPDREGAQRDILCVVEERVVGNDNTVTRGRRRLQLPESRLRPHFVRATGHALATAGGSGIARAKRHAQDFERFDNSGRNRKRSLRNPHDIPSSASGRPSEGGCLRPAAPTATGSLKITMQFQSYRCSQFHPVRCANKISSLSHPDRTLTPLRTVNRTVSAATVRA